MQRYSCGGITNWQEKQSGKIFVVSKYTIELGEYDTKSQNMWWFLQKAGRSATSAIADCDSHWLMWSETWRSMSSIKKSHWTNCTKLRPVIVLPHSWSFALKIIANFFGLGWLFAFRGTFSCIYRMFVLLFFSIQVPTYFILRFLQQLCHIRSKIHTSASSGSIALSAHKTCVCGIHTKL